jgi:hypothetical protein
MKNLIISMILLTAWGTVSAQPFTPQDSLLDRLAGKWVLRGTIGGKETTHDITAGWVLEHQYMQIKEVSREKDKNGRPEYTAIVYLCWEQKINQYSCLWLDNTGNGGLSQAAIGHAGPNGDTIALLFKGGDGSQFYNTFSFDRKADSWQWAMDGEANGNRQPFARVKLTKK